MTIFNLTQKSRTWNRTTSADGDLFELEFLGIFGNLENFYNYILADLNSKKGFIQGRLRNIASTPTIIKALQHNIYDVDGNLIRLAGDLSLDFSSLTNIYRNDGITPISATSETQNKFLYVMLTQTASLHAMLIPDSEMEGSNHSYLNNPLLLKDYYQVTPGIFSNSKNGYYKNGKRIIAFVRLNSSNQIEFVYELGIGHRFMDVQFLPIGSKFTELRWKREHPACYIPDGSTISTMEIEAPELYKILGTNILPNWINRFGRNIDLLGSRNLRDTQEDAFQGFTMDVLRGDIGEFLDPASSPSGTGSTGVLHTATKSSTTYIARNFNPDGSSGIPRVADETRPKNYGELVQLIRG